MGKEKERAITLDGVKPISTNKIWSGKRWLSEAAKVFKTDVHYRLLTSRSELKAQLAMAGDGDLAIRFDFGLARDMDIDNCLKLVIDVLSAVLKIDDKRFRGVSAMKSKVKRGSEYIRFSISGFRASDFEV